MSKPLNQALHDRLRELFGHVAVAQAGAAAAVRYGHGPFLSEGRVRLTMDSSGEYYRVNCPYCGDRRQRLWVNHLWGVEDDNTGTRNLWLCVCYNENCMAVPGRAGDLFDAVYGFRNAHMRGRQVVVLQGEAEDASLREVKPPGVMLPLDKLPPTDGVIKYLAGRGLDPSALSRDFGVAYCLRADPEYAPARDRIYIPVVMHGVLVGWQCRLASAEGAGPKYYNKPNMPRRLMLYNYDSATRSPYVVVCEGPTDAWNVGPYAVAGFGKHLSFHQVKLLCEWQAVVVMLDGDAQDTADELVERLGALNYKGRVVIVRLPVGVDPGGQDAETNNDCIASAAEKAGVDLASLRSEDGEHAAAGGGQGILGAIDRLRRFDDQRLVPDYSFDVPRDAGAGA